MIQTDIWLEKAKELYNIKQNRKSLEKREAELETELRILTNNEAFSFGGMKYFFEIRTGSINYPLIPELQSIDLEKYRKPSVSVWKLAIESIL